jgi:hypothetical protein
LEGLEGLEAYCEGYKLKRTTGLETEKYNKDFKSSRTTRLLRGSEKCGGTPMVTGAGS